MAHGIGSVVLKRGGMAAGCGKAGGGGEGGGNGAKGGGSGSSIGSRRIFAPHFKLQVLDSYRSDADCKGNQRATARKYGIHRRQIQKWLQVEGNLRSSVKGKEGGGIPEVSATYSHSGSPLDFSTRHRSVLCNGGASAAPEAAAAASSATPACCAARGGGILSPPPSPRDPSAPIDLSVRRGEAAAMAPRCAPVVLSPVLRCGPPSPVSPLLRLVSPPSLPAQPHPDVWDLSTKTGHHSHSPGKRKWEEAEPRTTPPVCPASTDACTPKPIKLFKPYLDDVYDSSTTGSGGSSTSSRSSVSSNEDYKHPLPEDLPLCCAPPCPPTCGYYPFHHNNNNNNPHLSNIIINNNNNVEIKSEFPPSSYTLHELQPKSPDSITYYYATLPPGYAPSDGGYDILPLCYDEMGYAHGSHGGSFKQRHSYSLDFKLSAIDCYYRDSICKGNQRAVASKYNIHRRQVQKWLKQANELRQKNETVKQTQTVR